MNKKFTLSVLSFLFLTSILSGQWITLDNRYPENSKPIVTLLSNTARSTTIKIDLPGFFLKNFSSAGKNYSTIELNDMGITTETGYPEISHISRVLAIPDRGTVSVEVINKSEVIKLKNIYLAPARESWIEGEPETPYVENINCYNSEKIYPENIVRVEDPAVFRDFRIARVSVFPVRYSPLNKELEIISSITIRVNYEDGEGINPKTTPDRPIAPSFDRLYRNFIFNYNEVLNERYEGLVTGHDKMLCIIPDANYNSFLPYADWKNKTGTEIKITKFSQIGATSNNPTVVRDHILSEYLSNDPPTHVLLIGDNGVAPIKLVSYDYTFPNEDYFVELVGNDYFPELMIGRFTNSNDNYLQIMVNKFIKYEKSPYKPATGGDWFKRGVVCSNNLYDSQIETKRFTAQSMLVGGQFLSVDTLMSNGTSSSTCTVHLSDVLASINAGRSFLNYRGEGWTTGWSARCYSFNTTNVNSLNNGEKLTFVTSIGCGVAGFNASGTDNCFGEAWIELGSLTQPRGACAFVGPTSNTHTTYNNKIDLGIYMGMFPEGVYGMDSPGEALLNGKLYMYNYFGNIQWVEYHYRIYCVLGDPSIHVWKNIPKSVIVSSPDSVFVGLNQVQIVVKDSSTNYPIGGARITITGNGVYAIGTTDGSGKAIVNIVATSQGVLNLAVCGGSVIPVLKTISVVTGTENITPIGQAFVDDLDGNNDGLMNPNENGIISFTLKNWGTIISNNVCAKISLPDSLSSYIQIITVDSVNYGNIAPNDSSSGSPFQFFVNPDCPIGLNVPFKLHVYTNSKSWDYIQNIKIHGCKITYNNYTVDDSGNTLQNYRMDPGETVKLRLNISNKGDDIAPDVKVILSCNDQYITILDSVGTFGNILKDSSAINNNDFFVVKVSENCPVKYNAFCNFKIKTQNGLYPYSTIIDTVLEVAMPSPLDPTGPDVYGYYAYSSVDTLWAQAPKYNWVEINGIGTEIPKPTGYSNFTRTVTLPFTFKYYGNNFTQVRINSDGWIAFGSGTQTSPNNRFLPCLDTINNMAAIFWDDFFSNAQGVNNGKLLYYSDTQNHRFIVEWLDVVHVDDTADVETFQVILLDPAYYPTPTGDGELILQYKIVEESGSCSIGIEDNTETVGTNYLFDETYNITANEISNNFAIRFTTKAPIISDVKEILNNNFQTPDKFILKQNYPNPFNPSTRIAYSLPAASHVTLKIYRVDGQLIRTLQNGLQKEGSHEIIWDGRNESGVKVSSGIYFYELQADNFNQTKKMILLK